MRQIKYVYVLVSSETDYYYEQCLISVNSLLFHNPGVQIVLVTDNRTAAGMVGFRGELKGLCSEVIVRDFDDAVSNKVRSRLLKTSIRNLIDGDFLFLDLDTVISGDLSEIENTEDDVACVLDLHLYFSESPSSSSFRKVARKLGYQVGFYEDKHFNSGVIYAKDTAKVKEFFKLWNQLYIDGLKKGIDIDQPSFNEANCRMEGVIGELDGIWNVQTSWGLQYIGEAKVIHYFISRIGNMMGLPPYELCSDALLKEIKDCEQFPDKVKGIIQHPTRAFMPIVAIRRDSGEYQIYSSVHMNLLKVLYQRFPRLYRISGKVFSALSAFRRICINPFQHLTRRGVVHGPDLCQQTPSEADRCASETMQSSDGRGGIRNRAQNLI